MLDPSHKSFLANCSDYIGYKYEQNHYPVQQSECQYDSQKFLKYKKLICSLNKNIMNFA